MVGYLDSRSWGIKLKKARVLRCKKLEYLDSRSQGIQTKESMVCMVLRLKKLRFIYSRSYGTQTQEAMVLEAMVLRLKKPWYLDSRRQGTQSHEAMVLRVKKPWYLDSMSQRICTILSYLYIFHILIILLNIYFIYISHYIFSSKKSWLSPSKHKYALHVQPGGVYIEFSFSCSYFRSVVQVS